MEIDHAAKKGQEAVLLVHGLLRTRGSMRALERAFSAAGYHAERFGYRSSGADIQSHVRALAPHFSRLSEAYARVHFVTHSLGGLVVRGLLRAHDHPPGVGRVVMIAPPNQGSQTARRLLGLPGLSWFYGPSGQDLRDPAVIEQLCATPRVPFLIIAGTRTLDLRNPTSWVNRGVLAQPHDGTVTLEETRLEGATDYLEVDETHTLLPSHPRVIEAAVAFVGG